MSRRGKLLVALATGKTFTEETTTWNVHKISESNNVADGSPQLPAQTARNPQEFIFMDSTTTLTALQPVVLNETKTYFDEEDVVPCSKIWSELQSVVFNHPIDDEFMDHESPIDDLDLDPYYNKQCYNVEHENRKRHIEVIQDSEYGEQESENDDREVQDEASTGMSKTCKQKIVEEREDLIDDEFMDHESPVDDSDLDPDYKVEDENGKRQMEVIQDSEGEHKSENDDREVQDEVSTVMNKTCKQKTVEEIKGKEKRSKKRARTENQKAARNLEKYKLLPSCECSKKCAEHFTEEWRFQIFESFWRKSFGERRQYLDGHVTRQDVKRRSVNAAQERKCSLTYTMRHEDGTNKVVCKTMFLRSHGLKSDGMITELKRQREISNGKGTCVDQRGKSTPSNKIDIMTFKNHINSYHPQVSHYKLVHAPNRRYLPPDLSIAIMYKDYCTKFEHVSYEKYRTEFNNENIGFDQPSQDDCDSCVQQKQHEKVRCVGITEDTPEVSCQPCVSFNMHHNLYVEARAAYQSDRDKKWDKSYRLFSVDMQKILLLPKMSLKSSVFISRLVTFNETFAALNQPNENICVLWHEAISGRNAEDVASSYCAVMKRAPADIKHFIFWCDNCSAQNKNWKLFSAFVCLVNVEWGPSTITLKYFETGHTFMKADAVHGQIGKAWKKTANILDLIDLNELIIKTSRKNKTLLLTCEDFYEFKDGVRRQQRRKNSQEPDNIPLLNTIKVAEFRKGTKLLHYKERHTDNEFSTSDFLKPKFDISIPATKEANRGMNSSKKDKILKDLVPKMPPVKRMFWNNIPTSDVSTDLLSNLL